MAVTRIVKRLLNVFTAKGDLLAFDGTANVILPVGTNGQVLTADSTQTNGLKWASAIAGTGRNVLYNGNFNVWQRGTSFAHASGYTADRWNLSVAAGSAVGAIAKETTIVPSTLSANTLKLSCTTAQTPLSAGHAIQLAQPIEGFNFQALKGQAITLSFMVYSSKIGKYCVSFRNGSINRSYVAEYTVNSANTWESKSISLTADPSGTWAYDNTVGMYCTFCFGSGSTFQTSPNTWTSGNFIATSNQTNFFDSNTNVLYLSQVQIEASASASPFEVRAITTEYSLCQRYYFKTFPINTAPAQSAGIGGSIAYRVHFAGLNHDGLLFNWPVLMRTSPTIVSYNPAANNALWRNISTNTDSGTFATIALNESGIFVDNSQAAGDALTHSCNIQLTADAEF